jgi:hypothetical protein
LGTPHNAIEHIVKYLKGNIKNGILSRKGNNIEWEAFVNIDWVDNIEFKRLTGSYLFKMGIFLV